MTFYSKKSHLEKKINVALGTFPLRTKCRVWDISLNFNLINYLKSIAKYIYLCYTFCVYRVIWGIIFEKIQR